MTLRKQFLLFLFLPLSILLALASWRGIHSLQDQEAATIREAMLAQTRQHAMLLGRELESMASEVHNARTLADGTDPQNFRLPEAWMRRQLATQAWLDGAGFMVIDDQFKPRSGQWLKRTQTAKDKQKTGLAGILQNRPRDGIQAWITDLQTRETNSASRVAGSGEQASNSGGTAVNRSAALPTWLEGYWTPPYRDNNFSGDLLVSYILPISRLKPANGAEASRPVIHGLLHIDVALNRLLDSDELRPQGYINRLLEGRAGFSITDRQGIGKSNQPRAARLEKQASGSNPGQPTAYSQGLDWILLSKQGLYLHSRFPALIGQSIFDLAAALKRPDLGRLAELAVRGGSGFVELPAWSATTPTSSNLKTGPQAGSRSEAEHKPGQATQWITVAPVPGTGWSYAQSIRRPDAPISVFAGKLLWLGLPGILAVFAIIGLIVSGSLRQQMLALAARLTHSSSGASTSTRDEELSSTAGNTEFQLLTRAAYALSNRQQQDLSKLAEDHQGRLDQALGSAQSEHQQLQELQQQYQQACTDLEALQLQHDELQQTHQALLKQHASLDRQHRELSQQHIDALQAYSDAINEVQQTLAQQTEKAQNLDQELHSLTQHSEHQAQSLQAHIEQQAQRQGQIAELEQQISGLVEQARARQQALAVYEQQLGILAQTRGVGLWRVIGPGSWSASDSSYGSMEPEASSTSGLALKVHGSILQGLGLDPESPPGSVAAWLKTIHPDDAQRVFSEFSLWLEADTDSAQSPAENKDFCIRYQALGSEGATLPLEARGRKLYNEDGKLYEVIGTMLDLSEARQAEQSIQHARDYQQQSLQIRQSLQRDIEQVLAPEARALLQSLYRLELAPEGLPTMDSSAWQALTWQMRNLFQQLDDIGLWLAASCESSTNDLAEKQKVAIPDLGLAQFYRAQDFELKAFAEQSLQRIEAITNANDIQLKTDNLIDEKQVVHSDPDQLQSLISHMAAPLIHHGQESAELELSLRLEEKSGPDITLMVNMRRPLRVAAYHWYKDRESQLDEINLSMAEALCTALGGELNVDLESASRTGSDTDSPALTLSARLPLTAGSIEPTSLPDSSLASAQAARSELANRKLLMLAAASPGDLALCESLSQLGLNITLLHQASEVTRHLHDAQDSTLPESALLIRVDDSTIDADALLRELRADPVTALVPVIAITHQRFSPWRDRQTSLNALLVEPVETRQWFEVLQQWLPVAAKNINKTDVDSHAEFRSMAGINTQAGLSKHDNNASHYREALQQFADEHTLIASQIEQALIAGDKDTALNLSEGLRATAERLGADMLHETLKALTNVIRRSAQQTELQAISLAPTLAALRHVASSITSLARPANSTPVRRERGDIDPEQFSHRFRDLALLLHDQEPAASDCLAAIRSRFGDSEHSQDLDLIASHIEQNDYPAASRVLAGLMGGMKIG